MGKGCLRRVINISFTALLGFGAYTLGREYNLGRDVQIPPQIQVIIDNPLNYAQKEIVPKVHAIWSYLNNIVLKQQQEPQDVFDAPPNPSFPAYFMQGTIIPEGNGLPLATPSPENILDRNMEDSLSTPSLQPEATPTQSLISYSEDINFSNCNPDVENWATQIIQRTGHYLLFDEPITIICSDEGISNPFFPGESSGVISYSEIQIFQRNTKNKENFQRTLAHELGHMWFLRYASKKAGEKLDPSYSINPMDVVPEIAETIVSCAIPEGRSNPEFFCHESIANAVKDYVMSADTGRSPFKAQEYGCVGEGINDPRIPPCGEAYNRIKDIIFEGFEFFPEYNPSSFEIP